MQTPRTLPFVFLLALLAVTACSAVQAAPNADSSDIPTSGAWIGTAVREEAVIKRCGEMASYGARFTWMTMNWAQVEPRRGQFNWAKLDPYVDAAHSCGLDIGVHVMSNAPWAVLPAPTNVKGTSPSTFPKDLNDYYEFVFQLAKHYSGKISRYSIENEAHADGFYFSGTTDQYLTMLQTAHRAVKAADPDALVEDAGMSSSGIAIWLAADLAKRGETAEATEFLKGYFPDPRAVRGEITLPNAPADWNRILNSPAIRRVVDWGEMLFSHPEAYDVLQLHFYAPPEYLPRVTQWVHQQLRARGADKPIEFWEMGYRARSDDSYDPAAHARNDVQLLTQALGQGAQRAVIFQFTDYAAPYGGDMGLVAATGPRPAAEAFRVTAEKLNGIVDSVQLDLGEGVWAYRFDKPEGSVYVLWSTTPATVSLPLSATSVTITDIVGTVSTADPHALSISESPLFIEVK